MPRIRSILGPAHHLWRRVINWPLTPVLCLALLITSRATLPSKAGSFILVNWDQVQPVLRGPGTNSHFLTRNTNGSWRYIRQGLQDEAVAVLIHDHSSARSGFWHPVHAVSHSTFRFVRVNDNSQNFTLDEMNAMLDVLESAGEPLPPQPREVILSGGATTSRILWWGVAGDLAVLATLLVLGFSTPSLVRWLRSAGTTPPGLCPTCRYPLPTALPTAGPTRCPECGTDTPNPPNPPPTPP